MDSLQKKRNSMKGKVTIFTKHLAILESCPTVSSLQLDELKVRLSKFEALYDDFDDLQMRIEEASTDGGTAAFKEREDFEDSYFKEIARARSLVSKHTLASPVAQPKDEQKYTNNNIVRLPTIEIPRFDGRHQSWLEFRDSFISLIHDNEGIDDINKLRYLQTSLQGSPALLVLENLEICAANYRQAWKSLCERFDKPRLLVNKHLECLFNIDPINTESSSNIRRLVDLTNTNIRALTTLKQPVQYWDRIIVYLTERKLDTITSREWEQHRGSQLDEFPLLSDILNFLNNKADYLASLEESAQNKYTTETKTKTFSLNTNIKLMEKQNIQKSTIYKNHNNTNQNTKINTNSNINKAKKCPMCSQEHNLFMCEVFRNSSLETRNNVVREAKVCLNCLRSGHSTQKCKCFTSCKYCKQRHNTLLHMEPPTTSGQDNVTLSANTIQHTTASHCLLSTALVRVFDCNGAPHTARLLLDNGSTTNFATNELCSKLGLSIRNESSTISGISDQSCVSTQSCHIQMESLSGSCYKCNIHCFILPKITTLIPSNFINTNSLQLPDDIHLADPSFFMPSVIDILVGAETFWNVLGTKSISLGKNQPKLFETKLGWLVSGFIQQLNQTTTICNLLQHERSDLERFWELDSVTESPSLSREHIACEENFRLTTKRDKDGRFIVTMPLKSSPTTLGLSYHKAKLRFLTLEKRFKREPQFKNLYVEFMREYLNLGHMSENKSFNEAGINYVLPHHGIIRPHSTTTKLRVVFDASAPSSTGVSLNDLQMVGPTVQEDLFSILLRFRQHKYIVSADVEKMYRCIMLDPSQRHLQQILFRFNENEPIKTYTLNSLTYGTASAPYIATKCLVSLASSSSNNVEQAIRRDFYVDDYLGGGNTIEETIQLSKGVSSILKSAQFNLRKWNSNCPEIIKNISVNSEPITKELNLDHNSSSKTLGIYWQNDTDILSFSINILLKAKITKRHILSVISQIFDPLGLIGPCIIEAKVLMQKLWMDKSSWDEVVSTDIRTLWQSFAQTLPMLNSIKIPRWTMCDRTHRRELHTFTDASETAYGACVYVRSITDTGGIQVMLLTSKNKIAPIKAQTMPRLELCAALLGARLCAKVIKALTTSIDSTHYWCDSTIVLGWLNTCPTQLQSFVRNRVAEIGDLTNSGSWGYVRSADNSADLVSRGVKADLIGSATIWWNGPSFLQSAQNFWPQSPNTTQINTQTTHNDTKTQNKALIISNNIQQSNNSNNKELSNNIILKLIYNTSNFTSLQRKIAYILRFAHNCLNRSNLITGHLTRHDLDGALTVIVQLSQQDMFYDELATLQKGESLPRSNKLSSLTPFIDHNKLLRVGGRLSNSPYSYDVKHPILLDSKHHLTKIIFSSQHIKLLHAGPQLLLANIRQSYWVLGGRNLSKKTVRQCTKCNRFKAQTVQPIMGQLPATRTELEYPFLNTGVDYAGPILISDRKGRGSRLIKSYICIFVCYAVKAVHLELVADLTKEAYIAALNRFIARRGKPQVITSDNGTTFVGACNQIYKLLRDSNISEYLADLGIEFKFVPAYTPHFNGISEAAVKSTKAHLNKILSLTHLTFEEMTTCLTQIESILNSRPLTPLSSDPCDLAALTPSHFLIGRPLTSIPGLTQSLDVVTINRLERYRRVEVLKNHFWSRFSLEYVPLLQQKTKWQHSTGQLKNNALVLIQDKTMPPLLWLLGRITKVYKGTDGEVRVADIKTKKGTLRRACNTICPLPEF